MSDYRVNIFYSDEDAACVADIPDLDACSALGQTAEQALNEVEKAKELWSRADERPGSPLHWPGGLAKWGAILTEDPLMSPSLSELLKLPPGERADLAMALWESLSNAERETELQLAPEDVAELDRRWADHVQRPESAIPWDEVRRKLLDRE